MLTRIRTSRPVGLLRYHLYRDVLFARPRRRACNICGWQGRRFLTYQHPHVLCPSCGSQIRHRLVAAALTSSNPRLAAPLPGGRVLHVSPEYCLERVLKPAAALYVPADYRAAAAVRQDATRMAFADSAFDLVVMCDVLEHIPDDRRAFAEIRRVLRTGGVAMLTVPQSDTAAETVEDPAVRTADERAARYGQPDHVRNYGADFADRFAAAGFLVESVSAANFPEPVVARHVLRPPVPLAASWGWNNRRVYVGRAR